MFQRHISEIGDYECLGGAEIRRKGIVGSRGRITHDVLKEYPNGILSKRNILVQNIVAHIENPTDHIKITASLSPPLDKYVILDTINKIECKSNIEPEYLWCLLNSKLINYYTYRFIYGKAIRTMHFDNQVTARIPVKMINDQKYFVNMAKKLTKNYSKLKKIKSSFAKEKYIKKIQLTKNQFDNLGDISFEKIKNIILKQKINFSKNEYKDIETKFDEMNRDIAEIQLNIDKINRKIDNAICLLYGLTEEEIAIVEEN